MKILVAGSKGFIGSSCFAFFSRRHSVVGCDILPAHGEEENYIQITPENNYDDIFRDHEFDVFINASGSAGVGFSLQNPEKDYQLNVGNVRQMLDALRKHRPHCRFINLSSAAVYGNPAVLPITENASPLPLSPYGNNKLQAEKLLLQYHREYSIACCSIRIFSAYGPGLCKQLFWDLFLKSKQSKKITLFGTGKESRDFIYIEDLVRAIELIFSKAVFRGECINVAAGEEICIRDAAEIFLKQLGNFELEFSGEGKPGDPLNWKADISKLKEMGFKADFNIERGLKNLAEAYTILNERSKQ